MKRSYLILLLVITIFSYGAESIAAMPKVLFVLPGETSYIASRTYNYFSAFYTGTTEWILASKVDEIPANKYQYIIVIEETVNQNGNTISANIKFTTHSGNGTSTSTKSAGWSNISDITEAYRKKGLEYAADIMKDIDPEFCKEIVEAFED